MKALAIAPGSPDVRVVDRSEPQIAVPDQVKLRIIRVGVCGTDRHVAASSHIVLPPGRADLVLGHEMFGQIVEIGPAVTRVGAGDYGVLTVRRGCGECLPCRMNRSDMCETGHYTERGIVGADGYQTEYVVDSEEYLVAVSRRLAPIGILTEPLSVAEKALDEAVRMQAARLPHALVSPNWLAGRRSLVVGLGPIGLLTSMLLRLRGAEVFGLDVVDAGSPRPQWLQKIGGYYLDGRQLSGGKLAAAVGPVDFLVEAAGAAGLAFELMSNLAHNGICVIIGAGGDDEAVPVRAAAFWRQLLGHNQAVFGIVGSARGHFQMAVDDLEWAQARWGDHIATLITQRLPYTEMASALHQHPADEIKAVVEWE